MRLASGGFPLRVPVLVVALLFLPLSAFATTAATEACIDAPLEEAARALVHPGAEVVSVDRVAGRDSALVLAPLLHPGVRFRLVEHDGAWCDAQRAGHVFAGADALEQAASYASMAAAPWFDGVRVLDAQETLPGHVRLTTHARTNGVVAEWLVQVDRRGVRDATFTASAFGVPPLVAEVEGLTALPGLTRTFTRSADGLLAATAPIVPAAAPSGFAITAVDRYSDGFRVQFHTNELGIYVTKGSEVGVQPVDFLDSLRAVTRENYEEFLSWGLERGWRSAPGHVYVNSQRAASCLACVLISQDFNIHIHSQIVPALRVLAEAEYADDRAALTTIVGHEMFHNFQNAYSKPTNSSNYMGGAYSEGLARFQETLHTYSGTSHQPDSLVYQGTANGCNFELAPEPHPFEFPQGSPVRWVATPTLADGPSTGQSYSACDFWVTFYGHHGLAGLLALLPASNVHHELRGWQEIQAVIETATGAPVDDDLARFAAAILTGEDLAWPAADGSGAVHDWALHLGRWTPATLAPGESLDERLRDGGMTGARVEVDGAASVTGDGAEALALYRIGDDASVARIADGASVTAPAWVVAIHPGVGTSNVTLSYA